MVEDLLSKAEREHLAKIIADVERHTAGEIRLMVVERSAWSHQTYATLWLIIICLLLMVIWSLEYWHWLTPFWVLPGLLTLAALLAWPLSRWSALQKRLMAEPDMKKAVWTRAELEFYREGLNQTRGATGILLMVSLFERQAVVLADQAINKCVQPQTWDHVVSLLLEGGLTGQWASAFEKAIHACGSVLREHVPAQDKNPNELPNAVILKE